MKRFLFLPIVAGCVVYSYEAGLEANYDRLYEAALKAVDELQFKKGYEGRDGFDARIDATRADGTPVSIMIHKISETRSTLFVRHGVFFRSWENRAAADRIRDTILGILYKQEKRIEAP